MPQERHDNGIMSTSAKNAYSDRPEVAAGGKKIPADLFT
jgi:hypothetical protein